MLISRTSMLTGFVHEMDIPVTQEEIDAWMNSKTLIQDAFPDLNTEQREFLMTGITPEEWDDAFGDDEYFDDVDLGDEPAF